MINGFMKFRKDLKIRVMLSFIMGELICCSEKDITIKPEGLWGLEIKDHRVVTQGGLLYWIMAVFRRGNGKKFNRS